MQPRKNITLNLFRENLAHHHPNCTEMTDEVLSSTIRAHWPMKNGVATIPFSFFSTQSYLSVGAFQALFWYIKAHVYPQTPNDELRSTIQEVIRLQLQNFEVASQGKLKFIEIEKPSFWEKGIYFYLTTPESLAKINAGAFVLQRFNSHAELNQAYVFYPNDLAFWKIWEDPLESSKIWRLPKAAIIQSHEIMHGIGFDDVEGNQLYLEALNKGQDNAFCSVLPYDTHINSIKASCSSYCYPARAIFPGAADQRSIALNYGDKPITLTFTQSLGKQLENAAGILISTIVLSTVYETANAFIANLALFPNQPVFSKKTAHFIVDSAIIGGVIYSEFPIWTTLFYTTSAIPKYLPDNALNLFPEKVKSALAQPLNLLLINLAFAYFQGKDMVPFLLSLPAFLAGTISGKILGESVGQCASTAINYLPQKITATLGYPRTALEEQKGPLPQDDVVIDMIETENENKNSTAKCSAVSFFSFFKRFVPSSQDETRDHTPLQSIAVKAD